MNDTSTAFELPCGYFMYLVEHKYEEHWQKVTLFESKEKLGWELSSPPCLLYCHLSLNTNVWQCFGTQNLTSHILSTETSGILVHSGSQISLLLQAGELGRLAKTRILGLKWSQRSKRSCSKWWKTRSYIWRRNTYMQQLCFISTKMYCNCLKYETSVALQTCESQSFPFAEIQHSGGQQRASSIAKVFSWTFPSFSFLEYTLQWPSCKEALKVVIVEYILFEFISWMFSICQPVHCSGL